MAEAPHQSGKVRFLSRPMRFLLMVVEQGTASRWCELLGRVGTHWLFLLAFCSLGDTDARPLSLWAKSRPPAARLWPVDARHAPLGPGPHGDLCAPSSAVVIPQAPSGTCSGSPVLGEEERAGAPAQSVSCHPCYVLGWALRKEGQGSRGGGAQISRRAPRAAERRLRSMVGQGARAGDTERVPIRGGALSRWLGVPGGLHTFDQAVISDAWSSLRQVMPLASGPSGMERYSRKRDSK